jgi:hypothetical protein
MFSTRTLNVADRAFFLALTAAKAEACAHRAAASMKAAAIESLLLRMNKSLLLRMSVFSLDEPSTGRALSGDRRRRLIYTA